MTGIDKAPSRSDQRPERITIREDQMKGRVRVCFRHGARLGAADLRLYQTRLYFAKHSLVIPRVVLNAAQRDLVSGPEDLHVYFRFHVVFDDELAALFHPNLLEELTAYERVFTQCLQCAGEYHLFDTANLEGSNLIIQIILVYPHSLEALVQHHALQVPAEEERFTVDYPQTRRGLERFQTTLGEAVDSDFS